jgi:hypothetical protein
VRAGLFGLLRVGMFMLCARAGCMEACAPHLHRRITLRAPSQRPPYVCAACTVANCAACAANSATTCTTCNAGYSLRNGQCSLSECGAVCFGVRFSGPACKAAGGPMHATVDERMGGVTLARNRLITCHHSTGGSFVTCPQTALTTALLANSSRPSSASSAIPASCQEGAIVVSAGGLMSRKVL